MPMISLRLISPGSMASLKPLKVFSIWLPFQQWFRLVCACSWGFLVENDGFFSEHYVFVWNVSLQVNVYACSNAMDM